MKRLWLAAVVLLMVVVMVAACAENVPAATAGQTPAAESSAAAAETAEPSYGGGPVKVATLAGPTGMGMIRLFDNKAYDISLLTSPDEITPKIISGEVSVATIPSNLAAVLYNKMQGGIRVAAVNTMGVLYILENGDTVSSVADLAGKTAVSIHI